MPRAPAVSLSGAPRGMEPRRQDSETILSSTLHASSGFPVHGVTPARFQTGHGRFYTPSFVSTRILRKVFMPPLTFLKVASAFQPVQSCHSLGGYSQHGHAIQEHASAIGNRGQSAGVQGSTRSRRDTQACHGRAGGAPCAVASACAETDHALAADADAPGRYGRAFLIRCASFASTVPGPTSSTSVTP